MHFTYAEPAAAKELCQGDVLRRTPALQMLLQRYYQYFGENDENRFFLVVTQSCDLVPREGGVCKARYIQLAAIRPLEVALERELAELVAAGFQLPFKVAGHKSREKFAQFARRLFNNNEPEYFFLHSEPSAGLPEDCCAFLNLSVSIKAEHYATCVDARILSLSSVFQAKLGWLVGQIYARVGTEDWEAGQLTQKVKATCDRAAVWIDDKLLEQTASAVRDWQAVNAGVPIDRQTISKLMGSLPNRKSQAIEHLKRLMAQSTLVKRLTANGNMTDADLDRLLAQIKSDQLLSNVLR